MTDLPFPLGSAALAGNLSTKSISELEVFAGDPDLAVKAAAIFRQHGCCVIRGLNVGWVDSIARAIERTITSTSFSTLSPAFAHAMSPHARRGPCVCFGVHPHSGCGWWV